MPHEKSTLSSGPFDGFNILPPETMEPVRKIDHKLEGAQTNLDDFDLASTTKIQMVHASLMARLEVFQVTNDEPTGITPDANDAAIIQTRVNKEFFS
jgi:hypothetical protein